MGSMWRLLLFASLCSSVQPLKKTLTIFAVFWILDFLETDEWGVPPFAYSHGNDQHECSLLACNNCVPFPTNCHWVSLAVFRNISPFCKGFTEIVILNIDRISWPQASTHFFFSIFSCEKFQDLSTVMKSCALSRCVCACKTIVCKKLSNIQSKKLECSN